MNSHRIEGKHLILILTALVVITCALPVARGGEAASFIGKKLSPDSADYKGSTSFGFTRRRNPPKDISGRPMYLTGNIITSHGHEVFLLGEGHLVDRHVEWIFIQDAIDVPKKQRLLGKPIEDECIAKNYPDDYIFVIGTWASRKKKNGDYVRYARSITKAWRVDFDEKKLKEVPTTGIKCEDDRTQADFD